MITQKKSFELFKGDELGRFNMGSTSYYPSSRDCPSIKTAVRTRA